MTAQHPAYQDRSILITGGLGFIGSNLARRLVELAPRKVTLLDALVPDQGGNRYNIAGIDDRVQSVEGDLGNPATIGVLVEEADYIFNLAAQTSHVESLRNPHRDLALNCAAQLTFLEACRRHNPRAKIVFASTRQVYGKPLYLPVDEEHPIVPVDVNGVHKIAAEHYHLLYGRLYGLRAACLRLTNTYGPRQSLSHDRQGFIGWFIRQSVDDGTIELFDGGRTLRELNFVDDVVEALLLAGASEAADGEIFNLGGHEAISLAEIASELQSLSGRGTIRFAPFPLERQLIDIGDFRSSYRKIEAVLGWQPRTPLRVGLTRTIEFYRQHRSHY